MAKIDLNDLYSYYAGEGFVPVMPSFSGFRHFRFRTEKGWRKVPEKISTGDDLKKWIVKLGGLDIYYSSSRWLNPHKVSTKGLGGSYHVADNLLLGNDLVFDIDAESPINLKSLDVARKTTSNIFESMKDYSDRYKFEYCAWTGSKGFRLSYNDSKLFLPEDPRLRIGFVEKNRKLFIKQLIDNIKDSQSTKQIYKNCSVFDQETTTNVMGVVRVLWTAHSTTGFISRKIPTSLLRRSFKTILGHIPYVGKKRPVILAKGEMIHGDEDESSPQPRPLLSGTDVSGLASLPFNPDTHTYFFSNKVLGVKNNFVPVFVYQDFQRDYKKELLELQKRFKLGGLYVFQSGQQKVVLSLKSMQRRQLQKVLNTSSSKTKYTFLRHKRIFIPFLMVFLEKIKSGFTGHLSRGHYSYAEPSRKPTGGTFCGWEQIEFIKAKKDR